MINKGLIAGLFALDPYCLHYRVRLNQEELQEYVGHTYAHDDDIPAMVKKIDAMIPRMDYGPGNPNTGERAHYWEIGREYSRVLYLHYPITLNVGGLQALADEAFADEFDCRTNGSEMIVRFWWD